MTNGHPDNAGEAQRSIHEFNSLRGAIIGLWAGIETSIDQANRFAWHYSDRQISNVIPIGLRWKLETFQKLHTQLQPFHSLRDMAAALVSRMNELSEVRHWMAHGVHLAHKSGDGDWLVSKSEFTKEGDAPLLERRFTRSELVGFRQEILNLALEFVTYNNAFVAKMPKKLEGDERS